MIGPSIRNAYRRNSSALSGVWWKAPAHRLRAASKLLEPPDRSLRLRVLWRAIRDRYSHGVSEEDQVEATSNSEALQGSVGRSQPWRSRRGVRRPAPPTGLSSSHPRVRDCYPRPEAPGGVSAFRNRLPVCHLQGCRPSRLRTAPVEFYHNLAVTATASGILMAAVPRWKTQSSGPAIGNIPTLKHFCLL